MYSIYVNPHQTLEEIMSSRFKSFKKKIMCVNVEKIL